MKIIPFALFALFLLVFSSATDYYVSNSGNDANTGTSISAPFRTIHKGVSVAMPGDTVYIRAGTYNEVDGTSCTQDDARPPVDCGTLRPIRDGEPSRPITFKGYPGDPLPVIMGNVGPTSPRYAVMVFMKSNLVFDSLEIANGYRGLTVIADSGGEARNIIIRNCHIHDNNGDTNDNNNGGIIFLFTETSLATNILIENNHIHHNRDLSTEGNTAGIDLYGVSGIIIRNNTIHDELAGIFFKGSDLISLKNIVNATIIGNTIYNVNYGIHTFGGKDLYVRNNLIYNFARQGLGNSFNTNNIYPNHPNNFYSYNTVVGSGTGVCYYHKTSPNSVIANNIFYNCGYQPGTTSCSMPDNPHREFANRGVAGDDGPDLTVNFTENYNLFYNAQGNYHFCWYSTPYTLAGWRSYWQGQSSTNGQNSISANPLFINAAANDYRLQSTSPACTGGIGGTTIGAFPCASGPDTTPPVISNPQPTGTLAFGTTSTPISVATNENANCKYSTSNQAYASMPNTFTTTGTTTHTSTISVTNGQSYTYYVRCQDFATTPNANPSSTTISFNVASSAPAPVINSVSGTISNNNIVTLNGVNFKTKSQAAPLKWSDFETGQNNVELDDLDPTWPLYGDGITPGYKSVRYSNALSHSGSYSVFNNIRSGPPESTSSGEDFDSNYFTWSPSSDQVFLSYWWRTNNAGAGDNTIIKMSRITNSQAGVYNGDGGTTLGGTFNVAAGDGPYCAYDNGPNDEVGVEGFRHLNVPLNTWVRVDMWKKLSTPGVANGLIRAETVGYDKLTDNAALTRASGYTFKQDTVLLGTMDGAASSHSYEIYIDDVYIDNTPARVEIANNANYDLSTLREIQIPQTWSDGSITFRVNQGTFTSGQSAYVFVVDGNGVASGGFPITIGSAPAAPTITNMATSSITSTTATITWTTNINSNTTVRYGTTSGGYTLSQGINNNVQSHSVSLSSLTASTTYYYVVISCNGPACTTSPQNTFATSSTTPSGPECPSNWQTLHPEWIFCDDFENNDLTRWDQNGPRNTVTSTAANVYSGNYGLQARIDPSTSEDNGDNLIKWFMPGYDEIYVRFYVKYQSGFQNNRVDGNGMHLVGLAGNRIDNPTSSIGHSGTRPTGTDRFTTSIDPYHVAGSPLLRPFQFYTYYPDMSCSGGCWGNEFYQTNPQTPLVGGQWNLVEARVRANTPGQNNGLQELWVDNNLKISVQNMRWRDTTDLRLNMLRWYFYMPNSFTSPQYIYVDNVVVSRNPIGPLSGSPSVTPIPSASPTVSPSITPSPSTCAPTISVDSTYSGYPTSVIDNDLVDANGGASTTWASDESSTAAHWVEKTFCTPITINNATIWWAYNAYSSQFMTSQQVQVQYFSGSSWQTAAIMPYPGANRPISTVSFAPISATRWRLYQAPNQGPSAYPIVIWLTEIDFNQAAATPSPSITPSPSVTGTPMPSTTPSPSVIPSVSIIPSISPSPSTIPCSENWSCTEWSACTNGTQTHVCLDLNSCGTTLFKPADTQSCNISITPSPSVSIDPSASVIPCVENWSCTGFNACSGGTQSQLCTDANNCGTTINRPPLTQSCTMPSTGGPTGGSGGYYAGPGAYVSPPTTSPSTKPNPSPSVSIKPSVTIPPSVQFINIKAEIETSLPDLTIEGQDEIQQLLDEAERLQKTGNTQQALVLLNRAKTRLNDLKTKKADYPWQLGLIALTILIGLSIYYVKSVQTKTQEMDKIKP